MSPDSENLPSETLASETLASNSSTSENSPLENRVALITGGGSGIGRAIALAFASAGARVAITGRRSEPLEACVGDIKTASGEGLAITGDVANPDDARRMVAETVDAFGGLHTLVNNAGVALGGPLEGVSDEDVDAVVDIDLKGPIHVTRAALSELMKHRDTGGASVLNISSSVTFMATRNFSVYSAAKAGLDMLTRCWALDWGEHRIRVNAICPGVVDTPIFSTMPPEKVQELMNNFAAQTPLGRVGAPNDIARLALFLAGPQSPWITGAVIPADGGLSLGR